MAILVQLFAFFVTRVALPHQTWRTSVSWLVNTQLTPTPIVSLVCQALTNTTIPYQVEESDVAAPIRSFPSGSAGGPDGLRPQHLLELANHRETSSALLKEMTGFINILLRGAC